MRLASRRGVLIVVERRGGTLLTMNSRPDIPESVAAVMDRASSPARERLYELRDLILDTSARLGVGPLEETLKWGEPAYLTSVSKTGSTIRLGWKSSRPDECFLFFNCQTSLVASFRERFADELVFEGDRAVVLLAADPMPVQVIEQCVEAALTYHSRKRKT